MNDIKIRSIEFEDNESIASLIRKVLVEMGVPKVGTAYEDASLDMMYQTYDYPKMDYYVIVENGVIIGGAGIAPLAGKIPTGICELQKMYFLPQARGRGIGYEMIQRCLSFAKKQGYIKCYLETMPYMEAARSLYKKVGFVPLDGPIGDTGHYNCQAWMIKEL
ncbi:GNAT family N-acetyltransferase [Aquimarina longa]|uniref:GNAT family N-acetyltransferase n=1 Tax=Aquimarina longa TaxID=1080221 RepID=UPI000783E758|nr:GNAT family N-acetyltransferase [Aquimarina longa]